MSATKILWGQIIIVFLIVLAGVWGATQWTAAALAYAPTTNFTANGGARMEGLFPADYASFVQSCFAKMANYPTAYCTEAEVADGVYAAATDEGDQLRYLAGADTKFLADLRWTTSEDEYQRTMRATFGPESS